MITREEIIAAAQRYWRRDKWNNEYFDAAGYADFVLASRDAEIAELKELIRLIFESTSPYREDGSYVFADAVIEKWKELRQ